MGETRDRQRERPYNEKLSRHNDVHFHEYAINLENAQKSLNLKLRIVCYRHWFYLYIGEDGSCTVCY